jgi:hypothetical protein
MAKRKLSRKKSKPAKRSRSRSKKRTAGQATNSRTHTDYNRNHVEIQVGTAQQSIARARRLLEDDLAKLFIRKRNAKTKTERNKIAKKMRELSKRLNRLT